MHHSRLDVTFALLDSWTSNG